MDDSEHLARLIGQLVEGWPERVEYAVNVPVHTQLCNEFRNELGYILTRHHECPCPKKREERARSVKQASIIAQLNDAIHHTGQGDSNSAGAHAKPKSAPPGNLDAFDLIHRIDLQARESRRELLAALQQRPHRNGDRVPTNTVLRGLVGLVVEIERIEPYPEHHADKVIHDLKKLVRQARMLLGYEVPTRMLEHTVCGECGGGLQIAVDCNSDVQCVGTPDEGSCGTVYRRWDWVTLAAEVSS